ncbi:hypothetical protein Pmar_PMAR003652 [Perkinsus marinus ATCC 50983]|uniref:Uncharacterized protein n=1 Tax=Perkinsus marinus (strain ATCC 50983 / TXsc) TaxID=423536 RepID=C5KHX7_PERM5|nr:hypothetical protein Pmar_PMAR003652 [Perkinsus marinus ATCC 50983]EER16189.1 hypothetical protein Pmar_PMAR003652 [Perkinsus marinus ATCC 50983]|eukprot:XP_002784393.1 hypothetical protein Pmar_PMAR003652 [Perkinsus marinus ATCC 50983]
MAKTIRNAKRHIRRETTLTNREILDELIPHDGSEEDYRRQQLQYYATLARNTELGNEEDVTSSLTDGSSSPDLCSWFEILKSDGQDLLMLAPLRQLLATALKELQRDASLWESFIAWIELPRDSQGLQVEFLDKMRDSIQSAGNRLRNSWATLLDSSTEPAPSSPLCVDLLHSLMTSTTRPTEKEDLLICDEISRGCNIGIRKPIKASGLWPSDKGPKYTGYELALWAADSWKNYKSCEEAIDRVQQSLDKEVSLGHMTTLPEIAEDSVCTKIACVVKPSGVNEQVRCEETICLPGLRSAAYLVQHLSETTSPKDPLFSASVVSAIW